jgi:ubiquinone/menaquinone biosynthesis C-methylase UbiE
MGQDVEISEGDDLATRLLAIANSSWTSQALYAFAQLNLADLLAGGSATSEQLAAKADAHTPSLHRLLRAMVTIEIVREHDDGSFELTPMGALLRSDIEESVRSWVILVGRYQWQMWGHLVESVRTGESVRKLMAGTEGFQHLELDEEMAEIFNQAMVQLTRLIAPGVVRAYNFSEMKRIVDVGGGYGELLAAILKANPKAHGVLFDLPHAIQSSRRHLESAGVADRCELIMGDFFESIPAGADAYILKSILHDWNDQRSKVILESCRRAMNKDAKLLLVERVMPPQLGASAADRDLARSDLNMLISLAAKERTETDFTNLLESAGFRLTKLVPAGRGLSLLEANTR